MHPCFESSRKKWDSFPEKKIEGVREEYLQNLVVINFDDIDPTNYEMFSENVQ